MLNERTFTVMATKGSIEKVEKTTTASEQTMRNKKANDAETEQKGMHVLFF